jgi:hypothetical protein
MYAWIRLTLIFAAALVTTGFNVWAEEAPAAPLSVVQEAQSASEVVTQGETDVIEDDEAPADVPLSEPLPVEKQTVSGPKSSTDKIVEKFMSLDVDESKGVSMDEYITMVQERVMARYAAMDADADGEVTEDEYRLFWKTRMAKWYRLQR